MDNFQENFISSTFNLNTAYDANAESHMLHPQNVIQYSTRNVMTKTDDITMIHPNCSICYDKATGKHYGAVSCDGCKGFFRRSIRKNQKYFCRFQKNCVIDKDKRNRCRSCRLRKCYLLGMKREAVQNERDKTSRRLLGEQCEIPSETLFKTLLNAEMTANQKIQVNANMKIATVNDIRESLREQVVRIEEWSKLISAFSELSVNDRIALLRARAGNHVLLGLAKRSLYLNDTLVLANNRIMRPIYDNYNYSSEVDINNISKRILNELVKPLTEVQIDDNEFACLKAIIFFDPNAQGLSNNRRIKYLRDQINNYLEDYVKNQYCGSKGRLGELLLTIPTLQSISDQMIGQIQLATLFGYVQIDNLLQDILLGGSSDQFPSHPA